MEKVDIVFNSTLSFYAGYIAFIVILAVIEILYVCCNRGRKGDRVAIILVCTIFAFSFMLIDIGEFVVDYLFHDIVVVEGIYKNNDRSSSHSGDLGFFSVTIETDDETLFLTTAPLTSNVFVYGTYKVVAYYAPRSELLLYIDIVEEHVPIPIA